MNIDRLPGLTPDQVARVQQAGIRTCRQLLRYPRNECHMESLVRATGLSLPEVSSILQRAEITRVRGIGPVALASLLSAGVSSLADLAAEEPLLLHSRLRQATASPPNLAVIEHWIIQARRWVAHAANHSR